MNTDNFETIKTEILKRAKENHACAKEYGRAYKSDTLAELMQVIKDNFHWACQHKVLTPNIIEQYREAFVGHDIYLNVDVNAGFLLCDNASVVASDNASVVAYGNASVVASGNASVEAYGNASVRADDNASVVAYDNASVRAYNNASVVAYDNASVVAYDNAYCTSSEMIECKLNDKAIYRVRSSNTIYFPNDSINFVKQQ